MFAKTPKLACLSLALLMWGCAGKTDSATESAASSLDGRGSAIQNWVQKIQNDEDVLRQLNDFKPQRGESSAFLRLCGDKDAAEAVKSSGASALIADEDIEKATEILRSIPSHGTSYFPQKMEEIESLAEELGKRDPSASFRWQPEDASTLEKTLKNMQFDPDAADAGEKFAAMLKGSDCENVLPRYCKHAQKQTSERLAAAEKSEKLEALLFCELVAWAEQLRLKYPENDYAFDRFRKYVSDSEIVSIRKQAFAKDMIKRGVEAAFERIMPPDPQYNLLRKARLIYADAIAAGGWPEVRAPKSPKEAAVGQSYGYVPSLRARLKAEGYDIADTESDVFGEDLARTVSVYRDVHQLSDKKLIDAVLFRNMAIGPEKRLETIDLALQKYREQAIGSLYYYVKVNVPDFYAEIWRGKQRIARHKIIVGNNKMQRDPVTKQPVPDPETLYPIYPNRTPLQTSKINEIIFNPYWNVPPRIRIEELEPKLAENPNYYIENNYEEVNKDNPKLYYVRELPNPKNSLGKVKFMYPNPHNTYLHDTPAKAAFKNSLRALSHGCMRVQDPLKFAEILLTYDGQWDKKKVDEILNADPPEQTPVDLKHPVDVDVVYINARVDDTGVVAFLSDVYEYDAIRLGHITPKKLPKPKNPPKTQTDAPQ